MLRLLLDRVRSLLLIFLAVLSILLLALKGTSPEGAMWLGQVASTLVLTFFALWPTQSCTHSVSQRAEDTTLDSSQARTESHEKPERKDAEAALLRTDQMQELIAVSISALEKKYTEHIDEQAKRINDLKNTNRNLRKEVAIRDRIAAQLELDLHQSVGARR